MSPAFDRPSKSERRHRHLHQAAPNTNGFRGLCLEPTDLAVSKLAAARPKDVEFVRVLLREHVVAPDMLRERLGLTPSLDAPRRAELQRLVTRLGS